MKKILGIRSTSSMALSSVLGQLITYSMMPVLTRIFNAEQFSLYADFFAWVITLSVLITLRIEYAIPTKSSTIELYATTSDALSIGVFNTALLTIPFILIAFFNVESPWYYSLIPLAALFSAIPQVLVFLLSKQLKTKQTGWYRILNSLAVQFISIALGSLFHNVIGLISGYLFGQLIGIMVLCKGNIQMLWKSRKKLLIRELLHKYKDYIIFNTPLGILEVLQTSTLVLIIGYFYGNPFPGYLYMAWRILQAPINLISNNAYLINYHYSSEAKNNSLPYSGIITQQFKILSIIAILMVLVMWLFGPPLFEIILGEDFKYSGHIASALVVMYATQFAVSPFSYTAILENKQKELLVRNLVQFTLSTTGLIIMSQQKMAIEKTLILYGTFVAIIHLSNLYWYLKLSKT
jgi:O-antigen/teichoic acid export membrane protein